MNVVLFNTPNKLPCPYNLSYYTMRATTAVNVSITIVKLDYIHMNVFCPVLKRCSGNIK